METVRAEKRGEKKTSLEKIVRCSRLCMGGIWEDKKKSASLLNMEKEGSVLVILCSGI